MFNRCSGGILFIRSRSFCLLSSSVWYSNVSTNSYSTYLPSSIAYLIPLLDDLLLCCLFRLKGSTDVPPYYISTSPVYSLITFYLYREHTFLHPYSLLVNYSLSSWRDSTYPSRSSNNLLIFFSIF